MASRPDIILYDHEGQLLLVAEVKNKRKTTPQWAAELRRNLLAHEGFRHAEYFLVLTPDHLYLWRGMKAEATAVLPDFVADSRPLFLPYLQSSGLDLDRLSAPVFELTAISWLSDLVYSRRDSSGHGQAWLVESGLMDAVRNGRLAYDLAA
ncbi:MAG: hypothetical protein QOF89_2065 [Acidobacteriota bacterium]|jgi:hypothetical protein|nr:hypothetical protein [Acidobacteriota bacterium]